MKNFLRFLMLVAMVIHSHVSPAQSTNPRDYDFDYGSWGTVTVNVDGSTTVACKFDIPRPEKVKSIVWAVDDLSTGITIGSQTQSSCTIKARSYSISNQKVWCLMKYGDSSYKAYYIVNVVSKGTVGLTANSSGGTVNSGTVVKLTANPSDAEIYYTLDGSDPFNWMSTSKKYTSAGIVIDKSCTLKAIAYKTGYDSSNVLTLKFTLPQQISLSASPNGGTVNAGSKITLTSSPTGANIYYTLDGSTPTSNSKVYTSSGITINNDCTLKAIAMKTGYSNSSVLTANYKVTYTTGSIITTKTIEGIDMTFKVTNITSKECKVDAGAIARNISGTVTIPSTVDGFKVTSIGDQAFWFSNIASVVIPSSVTSIGEYAFQGCASLKDIKGYNNVEYIGNDAFTSTIWESNLPDGLNYIGKVLYLYKGTMPSDTKINIANGCTQIYRKAFYDQPNLAELYIPGSVRLIGRSVLYKCESLRRIIVDETNQNYDSRNNCNAIIDKATNSILYGCATTTIPSSVISVDYAAFYGNAITMEEIVIPNNVNSIAQYAFLRCLKVKSILVGKGLKEIGLSAFAMQEELKEIVVSASNPFFDSRDNCNAIIETSTNTLVVGCTNTSIPNTVKKIGERAFWGNGRNNEGLTSIVIPNSVEEIQTGAFSNLPYLTTVTIGAGVKILEKSFSSCKNIKTVVSLNGFPDDINEEAFDSEVYTNATLYVPEGCRNNYRLASGWNQFKNIVEGQMPSGIEQITMDSVSENDVVHSVSGQRLSAPQKGLNIINGKKYVVK